MVYKDVVRVTERRELSTGLSSAPNKISTKVGSVGLSALAGRPFVLRAFSLGGPELYMARQHKRSPALEVAAAIEGAWSLINLGSYDDAWAALLQAEEVAQRAGISSPFLHWGL